MKMQVELGKSGAYLDDIIFCPHHTDSGFDGEIPELKTQCECRKPKPGMLLKAIEKYQIDPLKSWMIGDNLRDIEAGKKANVKTIFINNNNFKNINADYTESDLLSAVSKILKIYKRK